MDLFTWRKVVFYCIFCFIVFRYRSSSEAAERFFHQADPTIRDNNALRKGKWACSAVQTKGKKAAAARLTHWSVQGKGGEGIKT